MQRTQIVLLCFLAIYLGLAAFCNRAALLSRFDASYWKDKYEQSQWRLPFSPRILGDDGLYLAEGYRLITGGDPTSANAEMPPLGKYLIGASVLLVGNGYVFGFLSTLSLLAATYLLARRILNSSVGALLVTLLTATDPLITNQLSLTMMDALQATLLLLYLWMLLGFRATNPTSWIYLSCTGLFLGLFAATKAPLTVPLIGGIGLAYLFFITRRTRAPVYLAAGATIGYLIPYLPYFFSGHTLMEWAKVQKWIVSFYLHSNLSPTWGSALTTLVSGTYQNIYSRAWLPASEWSPTWTFLLFSFAALIGTLRTARIRTTSLLFIVTAALLGFYAVTPFWTRYLVTILPLLYVIGMLLLWTHLPPRATRYIFVILLIINIQASIPILFPTPENAAREYVHAVQYGLFADLYELTHASYQQTTDRETFRRFGLTTLADGEIEHIDAAYRALPTGYASPQEFTVTLTYHTRRLGPFHQTLTVPFVRERNRWRIPWNWSYVLPGLTPARRLATHVEAGRRGTILASDKKPLAEDVPGVMIWITPGRIAPEHDDALITGLADAFRNTIPKEAIRYRIVGNRLPDLPVPIGVLAARPMDPVIQQLRAYPAVSLTLSAARATHPNNVVDIGTVHNRMYEECCSLLYATTTYDGVTGVEQAKNSLLKGINGGSLRLIERDGVVVSTFITTDKRDGSDVEP